MTSKVEVDKLDINGLTNVKKTVPVDLKKLSDVINNKVVKNLKLNTLKTKVNYLEKKIPDATTLIHINQYNTDKQNLKKKMKVLIEKYQIQVVKWLQLFWIQKINEVGNKILDTSSLVIAIVLNTKIAEVENKIPDHAKYITTREFNKLKAENFAARL